MTMEYKGFTGRVEYDDEAGLFHGEIVDTRDVVTFQGRSVDEIEHAFRDSVDDYLEFCAKLGAPPDKPFSGRLMVRLGSDLHRRLYVEAQSTGKSLNRLIAEKLGHAG